MPTVIRFLQAGCRPLLVGEQSFGFLCYCVHKVFEPRSIALNCSWFCQLMGGNFSASWEELV